MLFLAGGLAFNVLLALVPFVLLLIAGLALLLGAEPESAARTVSELMQAFLPNDSSTASALLDGIVNDVLRTKGAVGTYAAIGFAWFSTRLFGSLRSVLSLIFDGEDHGIVFGKIFDFGATLIATVAVVVYITLTTYLGLATSHGAAFLVKLGLHESAMSNITYALGRLLAVAVVFGLFYALYHGLPRRHPSVRTALLAAATASILLELARYLFAVLVHQSDPSSLYTGSIAAVVAVVFWAYYAALLFLIGGEVAQAVRLQRVAQAALETTTTANAARKTRKVRV